MNGNVSGNLEEAEGENKERRKADAIKTMEEMAWCLFNLAF